MTSFGSLFLPLARTIAAITQPRLIRTSSSNKDALYTVECEDAVWRFCKSGEAHSNTPACEWVAFQLAAQAGFAMLDSVIVEWQGTLFFGSDLVPAGRLVRTIKSPLDAAYSRVANRASICYEAICLDAWILNPDRHGDNLIFVEDPSASHIDAYLIDHDKGLMGHADEFGLERLKRFTKDPLAPWFPNITAWIRDDCNWRLAIVDWSEVRSIASRITSIPPETIASIVAQIPGAWIADAWRPALKEFLLVRQDRLLEIIAIQKQRMPNLVGGP